MSAGVAGLPRYAEIAPPAALAGEVRCFWFLESDATEDPPLERVVPDGCAELVVHHGEPFRQVRHGRPETQPVAVVVGQLSRPLELLPSRRARVAGVRFRADGAAAFVGPSLALLADAAVDATDALGGWAGRLPDDLAAQRSDERRAALLSRVLIAARRREPDPAMRHALDSIRRSGGITRMTEVAAEAGLSLRQLERRFADRVGLPPKRFARLMRFRRLVASLQGVAEPDWALLALEHGYSDQPHMTREFTELAGVSPTRWHAARHGLNDLFVAGSA